MEKKIYSYLNMKNQSIVIKNINSICGTDIVTKAPKEIKNYLVSSYIDSTKYKFVGFIDRSNSVVLIARYHNIRDKKGRFAKV